MTRSDEESLARYVLGPSLGVRRGETVVVEAWSHTLPWARAFVVEARRRAADVVLALEDEEAYFRSLALRGRAGFPRPSPDLARVAHAYVCFDGPEAYSRLLGLPTGDFAAVLDRHAALWQRATRVRRTRAARVVAPDITASLADRYGVDREAWRREVLDASAVAPSRLSALADRLARRLRRARRIEVVHPNGTELALRRRPGTIVADVGRVPEEERSAGRVWTQVPAGRVSVPLAPGGAEGRWEANRPVYDRYDNPSVSLGPSFRFRDGRLREFAFDRGGDSFGAAYRVGGPGRDRPAELTFGLNPRVRAAPELAEIASGALTLRIGGARGHGFVYRTTLVDADVRLDGRPFLDGGRLR